jgi:hypothetical protein
MIVVYGRAYSEPGLRQSRNGVHEVQQRPRDLTLGHSGANLSRPSRTIVPIIRLGVELVIASLGSPKFDAQQVEPPPARKAARLPVSAK